MKKMLSFFMCFIIIISVVAVPFSVQAAQYEPNTKIYADAYMLISLDDDSYPVVAQKNQNKRKFPASLTKIVTTMVTLENVKDLSAKTKVSKRAIESLYGTDAQVAGLKIGDTVTIEQLLYLTMVHSACDACQVLAEYVGGSVSGFADMMNKWAASVGAKSTHFVNPDGLHNDDHYTTASDMAKITLAAMKNDTFNKISSTKQYKYKNYTFTHSNYMMDKFHTTYYYEYAQGIKTGSTDQAGYCVITKASKNGYNYLAIVMDSPMRKLDGIDTKYSFMDAKALFEWAFDYLKYSTVIRQNDVVSEVPVESGKDADTVQLVAAKDVTTLVPSALDPSNVVIEPVNQPKQLEAPVTKGDKICTANIVYAGQTVATADLVAAQTVELSTVLKIMNTLKKFFTNKIVIFIFFLIILGALLYVIMFIVRLEKDKKRIAEKRRKQEELDRRMYGEDDFLPPPKR